MLCGRENRPDQGVSIPYLKRRRELAGRSRLPHIKLGKDDLPSHTTTAGTALPHDLGGPLAWFLLLAAGLMEVGWAIGLKYTEGFTRLMPSVLTLTAMAISMALLGLALKTLPIGTAYAVWTGIGAVGTAILGIVLFGDPATMARLACIGLIVAGIAGLKLVT
jgi:quaternary ammonium compound-resistance protein SugE